MLTPLVLPFQITAAIAAIAWLIAALSLRTPKRIALVSLATLVLFVPSCAGIKTVVDCYRYGRFEYASAGDIPTDYYIELPSTAKNVVLYRSGAGHATRFSIDSESLQAWINERRSLRPDLNDFHNNDNLTAMPSDEQPPELLRLKQELFAKRFPKTGWSYDPTMIENDVQRNERGGGYSIWHIPASGDTYLSASYW
jgi:hypothetical protein